MSSPTGSRDDERFDELAGEFAARHRRGERPSPEEYVQRLPEMADEIRQRFPSLIEAEGMEGESRDRARSSQPFAFPLPQVMGDYRVVREIGRGGMGVVYEAEQISLGRRVALKVLPAHVARDPRVLERFRREAKAAARLHHTNIVPVFEVGADGDIAFYAMQFIQGQGLDRVIDELRRLRGPRPNPAGTVDENAGFQGAVNSADTILLTGTAAAPNRKQRLGLVAESLLSGKLGFDGLDWSTGALATSEPARTEHLDAGSMTEVAPWQASSEPAHPASAASSPIPAIPPGGTRVSETRSSGGGQPFYRSVAQIGRQAAQGLAYAHARGIVHRDIKPSNLLLDNAGVVWITDFGLAKGDDDGLTATGDILGTVRYMAPERFRGEGDTRADIYALGLTLYELLTLRPAYPPTDRTRLIEQIRSEEPPRPRELDERIPRDLETIVLKAIDKDHQARYQSAEEMDEDLERFLADEPIRARRISVAERYWRWARRNPAIAVLGGVLTSVLVLVTVASLLAAQRFHDQAEALRQLAGASESQRREADRARAEEAEARRKADQANVRLQGTQEELYRTVYAARSRLGLAAWETNDVGQLKKLLELMRPRSDQPDLRGWEWRYLWRLAHEARLILQARMDDNLTDLAFSPDGEIFATVEARGRIQLIDRRSGILVRELGIKTGGRPADLTSGVVAIAFSPDGQTLAGPGPDASMVLYDVKTGQTARRLEQSPGAVLDLAWSPDGESIVAAFSSHVMRIFSARDGHLIEPSFGGHAGPIASVAFSPDGRVLASGSLDHTIKLWRRDDSHQPIAVLRGHTDEVRAVAFSPDGKRIASAGFDGSIRIWDASTGSRLDVIQGHDSSILALSYMRDGNQVVTGSSDQTVRLWDITTCREIRAFKCTSTVNALAVSPDGRDIVSACDELVWLWDTTAPTCPRTLQSPSVLKYGGLVECVAFSPQGRKLASGHDDNAIRVWNLASEQPPQILKGHSGAVKGIAFSPDGRSIASASLDRTVRIWDVSSGQTRLKFTGHAEAPRAVAFAQDSQTVLSAGSDRTIQAWDPATGLVRYLLQGHKATVNDMAFSPDGRTLASVSSDKTCILWDLPRRTPRLVLRGHKGPVNAVAFSADGKTLATASSDLSVRLWDVASGSPRGILAGHTADVDGLAFNPDGRLASSGWDQTIRIWDPASGQTVLLLKAHTGRIRRIKFSPDGRTLASASYDRTIKLWEAAHTSSSPKAP